MVWVAEEQRVCTLESTSCQYGLSFKRAAEEVFDLNTSTKLTCENTWGFIDSPQNWCWVALFVFISDGFSLTVCAWTYKPPWHQDREKPLPGLWNPGLQSPPKSAVPQTKPISANTAWLKIRHPQSHEGLIKHHFLDAHLLLSINLPPEKTSSWRSASPKPSLSWHHRTVPQDSSKHPE